MPAEPNLLQVDPAAPEPAVVQKAVAVLNGGGVVGLPTDTLYGLSARIDCPAALVKIRTAKGASLDAPMLFLVSSLEMAQDLWQDPLPERLLQLCQTFWAGPLTIVYTAKDGSAATADGTLALRLPALPLLTDLIEACGVALASTSANPHGRPPAACAREAVLLFSTEVDLWLDGGQAKSFLPSTVFDARMGRVIRPGCVSTDDIASIWGEPII